jgi:hypothetical protein
MSLFVGACELIGLGSRGGPYPEACASFGFSESRCRAIVERARMSLALDPDRIAAIEVLEPAEAQGLTLGVPSPAQVRFTLLDGTTITEPVRCGGIGFPSNRACVEDARLMGGGGGVDHDVPCAGEPPAGCATEPPTPRPASVAKARPLEVARLDIPLDRLGVYEIKVGEAGLPDGYLTDRAFELADDQPDDFWIDDVIQLDVRSTERGRPPVGSRFRDPFDGVEAVDVFLVFEVVETSPGAVLGIQNLVVR